MFEFASLNERVEDEIVLDYSEESIQRLIELLRQTKEQTGKSKHTVVIMGQHSSMYGDNFPIPDGIEIITKASIGHNVQKFVNSPYLDNHKMYYFLIL